MADMEQMLAETDLSVRLRLSQMDSRLTHGRSIEARIDDLIAALIELKLALKHDECIQRIYSKPW